MTPAVEALKREGIDYKLHQYSHDPDSSQSTSYGEEAAANLDLPPEQVFKTLVISADSHPKLIVAIVPVSHQLNLKAIAKAFKSKKATMADAIEAQNATGYILGGISPIGQKKLLDMVLDSSAENWTTIFISGGRRGLEIELAPHDLIKICRAKLVDIKN